MPLRVIIVDDERPAIEGLERLCERSGRVDVVGRATHGEAALTLARAEKPDALFLDIGMPGLGGMAVAQRLAGLPRPPLVVFVTAYDHYATEAFDLAVVDYVLKPIDEARLLRAIDRLEARVPAGGGRRSERLLREFWAPSRGRMVRVPALDILRIEAERDYVRIVTAETSFLLRQPISAMETRLDPSLFMRLHRSTITRLDRIHELSALGRGRWAAVDANGMSAPIGRSYLAAVRARFLHLTPP